MSYFCTCYLPFSPNKWFCDIRDAGVTVKSALDESVSCSFTVIDFTSDNAKIEFFEKTTILTVENTQKKIQRVQIMKMVLGERKLFCLDVYNLAGI